MSYTDCGRRFQFGFTWETLHSDFYEIPGNDVSMLHNLVLWLNAFVVQKETKMNGVCLPLLGYSIGEN